MKKLKWIGTCILLMFLLMSCGVKNTDSNTKMNSYQAINDKMNGAINQEQTDAQSDDTQQSDLAQNSVEQIDKVNIENGIDVKDYEQPGSNLTNQQIKEAVNNITWSSGFSIPVPKPDTEYIATYDYGAFCYDIDSAKLAVYLDKLEADSWCSAEEIVFESLKYYTYVKQDMIVQIIDHTQNDDNLAPEADSFTESYILVNFSYGYDNIKQRQNDLTKEAAAKLIQEHINQLSQTDNEYEAAGGKKVTMILEQFIEDSYEKMGLQAFTVLDGIGRIIGNYLICNESILYVFDSLKDVCVADIDKDSVYELLSLYGWGSGLYRIELSAYKYDNAFKYSSVSKITRLEYHNCFVPKDGFGKLSFKKISDTQVHLLDHDWLAEESGEYQGEPVDYGRILIDAGGHMLIPEMLEQFPYEQWEYAYNQDNIKYTDQGYETPADSLLEPPGITVSIGDVKLDYEVNKIKWNNETNESTNFTSLMEDEKKIPLFECPDDLLEFKDKIVLDFGEVSPDSIMVKDYLISAVGIAMSNRLAMDWDVKIEGNGKFTFGLYQHMALLLSSNSATYTNPSCRGFRVTCTFGENKTCEYLFVLMLGPEWD